MQAAIETNMPVLVEGEPGVGKTSLAKAVSAMLKIPLIKVQFYDGLTADKILYDYDYQRQLLVIEALKGVLEKNMDGMDIPAAMETAKDIDFYGNGFLIERPVLKALRSENGCVLLLDEVEKSSEEMEYTLLETLDNFEMSIPQYGTVKAVHKPVVFLTSNNYRELSGALKRRCCYLYINRKTKKEMLDIILLHAKADKRIAESVAACMGKIQRLDLKHMPSISEALAWAEFLQGHGMDHIDETLCLIAKNKGDADRIKASSVLEEMKG